MRVPAGTCTAKIGAANRRVTASALAVHGRRLPVSKSQAKPPAPPTRIHSLRSRVWQAFSLPGFCQGLLALRKIECLSIDIFHMQHQAVAIAPLFHGNR